MSITEARIEDDVEAVIEKLQQAVAPSGVTIVPKLDGSSLEVEFYGNQRHEIELTEARHITDDDVELQPGDLVIEVMKHSTNGRGTDGLNNDNLCLRYIHELVEVEHTHGSTTNADYALAYENRLHRTSHNVDHLTSDPDGDYEYFLIRP